LTPIERKYLLFFVDLALANGSLLAATTLWNEFTPSVQAVLAFAKWFVTLSVVWVATATVLDIYNLARSSSTTNILASTGLAALSCAFVYLSIPWLTPPIVTRTYALGFVLTLTLSLLVWRFAYARALVHSAFHRRALVLGAPLSSWGLVRELKQAGKIQDANPFRGSGYDIIGLVSDQVLGTADQADDMDDVASRVGVSLLGDVSQLVCLAKQHGADEIILASGTGEGLSSEIHEALLDCREVGLQISTLVDVYERLTARLPAEYTERNTHLLVSPTDNPARRLYVASKRIIDVFLGLLGLVALALVIPFVAVANALTSPGPLFYRQRRIGQGGRSFVLTKFRSMIPDAEKFTGAVWSAGERDPRITRVGHWLRKTRLDELPQVLSVLRGEMSIVGPRPERPCFVGEFCRKLPLYRARHAVKPGLTGWAQVRYRYGDSIEGARVKLEYDMYYVKHASLVLDVLIILQTLRVVLRLRGK
jgi:exopolysaccharide biosynthesis polyprenyl glycosylphosphotransferase